ncbi:ecto-ADP-ribosyltransferase 5-like [Discoglossus pictus]
MDSLVKCICACLLVQLLGVQVLCQYLSLNGNSFDDQYEGCTEEMEKLVLTKLLEEEQSQDPYYRTAWNNATERWRREKLKVPKGFRDEYGIAVMMYTNMMSPVYSSFNKAVREFGTNQAQFKYHSFHFLLTRAVVLLRSDCWWKTWSVYRGMKNIKFSPGNTENMRFGQFSSTTTDHEVAVGFGNDSFFTLNTRFGVDIRRFSYFPKQREILIPVDEVFQLTNFTIQGDTNKFALTSTKKRCHYYNCYYLKGHKSSSCVYSKDKKFLTTSVANMLKCMKPLNESLTVKRLKDWYKEYRTLSLSLVADHKDLPDWRDQF